MLKFFREKTVQKRIYVGLAVVIIPSFIISGLLLGRDNAKTPNWLGMIGSQRISFQKYLSSYQAVSRQLNFMYGEQAKKMGRFINLKGEAWDRLLLLDYAKSHGIRVSDAEVVRWISSQSVFSPRNQFDDRIYKMFVTESLRMTPRAFEEEMRDTLTIQKIRESLSAKTTITDEELKKLYNEKNGRKDILVGFMPMDTSDSKLPAPSDKDLESLYPLLQDNFKEPESIKIRFVFIPKEKEDALKAAFDEKSTTLEALAAKYSLTPVETGFFSPNDAVPQIGPVEEVLEAAFGTEKDKESDWIHTAKGSYKLKVVDKKEAHTPSFEEAKDKLKEFYKAQLAAQDAEAKLDKLADQLKSGDFEKILTENGAKVSKVENFGSTDNQLPGIGASPRAFETASGLKAGEVSAAFMVQTGAAVIKVLKESPADDKKFEEEKKGFKEKMTDEKTSEQFKLLLESLRKTQLKVNVETMRKLFPDEPAK